MKNTRMIKAIALGISATLLLQPIAVYAEDEAPAAAPVVEAPAPAPEAPAAEAPAPQLNDSVEAKVVEAEVKVEAADATLPDQETTDQYLENADAALKVIDGRIDGLDVLNDKAAEEVAEYNTEVAEAVDPVGDFVEEVKEVAPQAIGTAIGTTIDYFEAHQDANDVVDMASQTYTYQADAEAAKEVATGIAADAQAKADDAAQLVEELGEKLEEAELIKNAAETELTEAEKALFEANQAVIAAEKELRAIQREYGLNDWYYNPESPFFFNHGREEVADAINNAQAALLEATRLQGVAAQDLQDKQDAYDDANQAYLDAEQARTDALNDLDDAMADLNAAKAYQDLINKVNGVETTEISTWNTYNQWYNYGGQSASLIDSADKALAKALVEFKLYGNTIKSISQGNGNNKFVVTYVDADGNTHSEKFLYEIENKTYQVNGHSSVHWLQIKKKVNGQYVDYYKEYTYYTKDRYSGQGKVDEAQDVVNGLNEIINKDLTELDQARQDAQSEIGDAEDALEAAGKKLGAVQAAYTAVVDAAKALKNLQANERASAQAVNALRAQYNFNLGIYNSAVGAYYYAAMMAGLAQDEADRALEALNSGFEYEIPTPSPSGQPTGGEPTGGEPSTGEPAYIPSAPIAAAPVAPAPQAAVLGETRSRNSGAAVKEAGEGEEVKEAAPAAEKKVEEKKEEEKKPAVAIEDEETARAAAPIEAQKGFPWWVLIILAAITALSIEEYTRRKKQNANNIQG